MNTSQDFKSMQDSIQSALVAATKTANRIAAEDLSFQRTVNPTVADRLDDKTTRLLQLSSSLLKSAAKSGSQKAPNLEDADDIDISWRGVVDIVDSLLERADTSLDEYTGLVKRKDAPTTELVSNATASAKDSAVTRSNLFQGPAPKKPRQTDRLESSIRRANIVKPQNSFERKPENFGTGPWKPILTKKPHALVPLESSLGTFVDENLNTQYKHPYEAEILNLKYPDGVYHKTDPTPYLPVQTTAAVWVDTFDGVLSMLEELKQATEIAIDLEHHDFRTYNGLLSLMQISTRHKDWVVDTLKPWRHRLEILNEVFADPSKVKVFHGAYMDIVWLQRDLGLYVVGLFDTFYACEGLGYPGKSLAYLLKRFADFDADKKYQMADWRIRPLTEEMFYYARSDTHYLLYIFDMVRNELISRSDPSVPENNVIEWVLEKSKETSLFRHENLLCEPETGEGSRGWYNALSKSPSLLTTEQFAVYRALHNWRDVTARREDESPVFVLSPQSLMQIAKIMPPDMKALWSLITIASHLVKSSADALLALIQDAKAHSADGPSMLDVFRPHTVGSIAKAVFGDSRSSKMQEEKKKQADDIPDITDLRTDRSQLWGSVPVSSLWEGSSRKARPENGERVPIPWGSLSQNFAANSADVNSLPSGAEPRTPEGTAAVSKSGEEEGLQGQEFTLRAGRKLQETQANIELASDAASDDSGEGDDEEQQLVTGTTPLLALSAKEIKQQRREKKKRKREQKRDQTGAQREKSAADVDKDDEFLPFDYDSAKTVLHAKRANGDAVRGKKAFDPYASKMSEAPKGARRMHSEKAGKTATFQK